MDVMDYVFTCSNSQQSREIDTLEPPNTVTVTKIRAHYYKLGQAVQTPNGPVRPYLLHLIAIDSTSEIHHFQLRGIRHGLRRQYASLEH